MKNQPKIFAATDRQYSCDSDPDRRVLRKIAPLNAWPKTSDLVEPIRTIAVLDCETTGVDPDEDSIIEMAVALIEVDAVGTITKVVRKGSGTQDPAVRYRRVLPKSPELPMRMLRGRISTAKHS